MVKSFPVPMNNQFLAPSPPGVTIFVMTALFPDTRPEAEAVLIRLLRTAPTWRKLEMVDHSPTYSIWSTDHINPSDPFQRR